MRVMRMDYYDNNQNSSTQCSRLIDILNRVDLTCSLLFSSPLYAGKRFTDARRAATPLHSTLDTYKPSIYRHYSTSPYYTYI